MSSSRDSNSYSPHKGVSHSGSKAAVTGVSSPQPWRGMKGKMNDKQFHFMENYVKVEYITSAHIPIAGVSSRSHS